MPTIIDHLRFRLAFTHQKRETLKNIGWLFALFACFAIGSTLDYQEELRQQAEAAQYEAGLRQAAMLACLNGGSPGYYTMNDRGQRIYLVCDVYEVTDENVTRKKTS